MTKLENKIVLNADGDNIPSETVSCSKDHFLNSLIDSDNRDVYLEFSSREALYDFAKALLHEAIYGQTGQKEFYPLIVNGEALVVNGVRLTEDSSRIFVQYPDAIPK